MPPPVIVALGIDTEATFDPIAALTLAQAAPLLRGRTGPPSPEVVQRWANPNRGCRVGRMQLVLPAVKIGNRVLTMRAWVEAFARMRTKLGLRQPVPVARMPRQRAAAQRRATEELHRAGIG